MARSYKSYFPIFEKNPGLIYLDSAATALKPQPVIEALLEYHTSYSANVMRGECEIAEKATLEFEKAREKVARFLNVSPQEIIFTKGSTESLNLASYLLRPLITSEDLIAVTIFEHHSNFLPWKKLAEEKGASFEVWGMTENFEPFLPSPIPSSLKVFAFSLVSNVLGQKLPGEKIITTIKEQNPNTLVIVDASQAAGHFKVEPLVLGADVLAFSGHKIGAPPGIGVLWVRKELLEALEPPFMGGGQVKYVSKEKVELLSLPYKFEPGTPNIAGAIALGVACEFLEKEIGWKEIAEKEKELTEFFLKELGKIKGLDLVGPKEASQKIPLFSFNLYTKDGVLIHPHDILSELSSRGICARAGHHCAIPLHEALGLSATLRVSCFIYNDLEDLEALFKALSQIVKLF